MKISCLICGKAFDFLPTHIIRAHGVSVDDYRGEHQMTRGTAAVQ